MYYFDFIRCNKQGGWGVWISVRPGRERNSYRIVVLKSEGKKYLVRLRRGWGSQFKIIGK
jgi:hypothetical protein